MGHLLDGRDRFEKTPTGWLKFGQQVGEVCNTWADRDDIVAFVGEGAGQGIATACWAPASAEMELNVRQAFGEGITPDLVADFTERSTHFDHPAVAGATLHEAMHARHTRFPLNEMFDLRRKKKTFAVSYLIEWFEETRIESRGVRHWPRNRSFLRACALKLSLSDPDEVEENFKMADPMSLSKLMLLSLARVDAGVLEADDVKKIRDVMVGAFGEDLLADLRQIWVAAQAWDRDDDVRGLRRLAERWVKLMEDAGHNTEPEVVKQPGSGSPGEEGEEGSGGMAGAITEATEAMEDAAEETEIAAGQEANEQAGEERDEAATEAAAEAAKERKNADEAMRKVFGAGTADTDKRATSSKLVRERKPTPNERAAAVIISRELEKARYRDRYQTKHRSQLPPGRMSGRGAMLRDIQRDQGSPVTAEPFTVRRRHHVEDPRLRMGLATDVSGSMSKAMEPMAVTNYVLGEAGYRIDAQVASVYYGDSVFPGLRVGQRLDTVRIMRANDSTERFNIAFKALNGAVDLLDPAGGARLLVIVSDMIYTAVEVPHLKRWVRRCNESGCAVLVLPASGRTDKIKEHLRGLDYKLVEGATDPVKVATQIGRAAAEELTKVGTRARM
jgi:hypothetical protein